MKRVPSEALTNDDPAYLAFTYETPESNSILTNKVTTVLPGKTSMRQLQAE